MENLTLHKKSEEIAYHVAHISDNNEVFDYNGARCFNVKVPDIGAGKAVIYDVKALLRSIRYCEKRKYIEDPVFFIMACRIGPFMKYLKRRIERLGGTVVLNPDGHDWARAKWSRPVKAYWKISEKLMVKHADMIVCDSREIEKYIVEKYKKYKPATCFVPYGTDTGKSILKDDDRRYISWLDSTGTRTGEYYLAVARLVEENNFDIIIREFIESASAKKLIIISTMNRKLYKKLDERFHIKTVHNIRIIPPIYDKELVKKIRENAFANIHGHEVGGTNPSLLEALSYTELNLVYDVKYNREVAQDAAIYWNKDEGNLADVIGRAEAMDSFIRKDYVKKSKDRIRSKYTWDLVADEYEKIFTSGCFTSTDEIDT